MHYKIKWNRQKNTIQNNYLGNNNPIIYIQTEMSL